MQRRTTNETWWGRRTRELLGVVFLLSSGCNGITSIEVERTSMAVIFDDDPLGDLDLPEFRQVDIFLGEFENEQGIRSKDISGASLESLSIRVVDPEGADLSFAESIEIFVEAPGEKTQRVAYQDEFPPGEDVVEFELDGVDLEPYIVSRTFTLRARVEGRRPAEDTLIEGTAVLDVGVTLAGVCHHM